MPCEPEDFAPLITSAATELAKQINAAEPSAERLVRCGFSWNMAFALARQIEGGGNASILFKAGLSGPLSKAIAAACETAFQGREAARRAHAKAQHGHNLGRKMPRSNHCVPGQSWFW